MRAQNSKKMRNFLIRAVGHAEYCAVSVTGILFGCSPVIRYLRNPNPRITAKVLRRFGAHVGIHTTLKGSLLLDNVSGDRESTDDFRHLNIGSNCYVGDGVFLDLANEIRIEDDVVIAGRASFITHAECGRSSYVNARFPRQSGRIVVRSGAWVGFGATVLHGVVIGENCVVGANALVTENTESCCVYVGTPARKIKAMQELTVCTK